MANLAIMDKSERHGAIGQMTLIDSDTVRTVALAAGLELQSAYGVDLPGGKSFSVTIVKRR